MGTSRKPDREAEAAAQFEADLAAVRAIDPQQALRLDRRLRELARQRDESRIKYEAALKQQQELEHQLEVAYALQSKGAARKWGRVRKARGGSACGIMLLSDIHCEEHVTLEETNGLNEHTLERCEQKLKTAARKGLYLLDASRKISNIRTLLVWLGGDLITGHLHPENVERNLLAPTEASFWICDRLESLLRFLAEHCDCDEIVVPTNWGNHDRDTPKMYVAGAADRSYAHAVYKNLRVRLRDVPRVRFVLGAAYNNYVDVFGYTLRFNHGHAIRYKDGVGGLSIPANKAVQAWETERPAYWTFFGHLHTFLPNWANRWVCNGSLIGWNPFGLWAKAPYAPPYQTWAVLDRDHGMVEIRPIFCDEGRPPLAAREVFGQAASSSRPSPVAAEAAEAWKLRDEPAAKPKKSRPEPKRA